RIFAGGAAEHVDVAAQVDGGLDVVREAVAANREGADDGGVRPGRELDDVGLIVIVEADDVRARAVPRCASAIVVIGQRLGERRGRLRGRVEADDVRVGVRAVGAAEDVDVAAAVVDGGHVLVRARKLAGDRRHGGRARYV